MAKVPTIVHNNTTTLTPADFYIPTINTVNGNVVGHGTYVANSGEHLNFLYGANAGQTIELNGPYAHTELQIADPKDFHAHVTINYVNPPGKAPPGWEQVDVGMAMVGRAVDSYSFKNDMLSLWSHNKVVQTLSLTVNDPYGITVQAAPGGWIYVSANDRTNHGIEFLGSTQPYPAMALHP